jgi:hypothetical protein
MASKEGYFEKKFNFKVILLDTQMVVSLLYCFEKNLHTHEQCCGSGSDIRCLFDPWIRDPGWIKISIRDPG